MACCDSLSSFPVGSVCWPYYYVDFTVSFGWSGVWKLICFYSKQFYCTVSTTHKLSKMDWYIHGYSVSRKFVFYSSIQWVKLQSTTAWVFVIGWTAKAPQGKHPPNLMVAEYIKLWKWPVFSVNLWQEVVIFTGCNFSLKVKMLPAKSVNLCCNLIFWNVIIFSFNSILSSILTIIQPLSTGVNGIPERETEMRILPTIMIYLKMSLAAAGECQQRLPPN